MVKKGVMVLSCLVLMGMASLETTKQNFDRRVTAAKERLVQIQSNARKKYLQEIASAKKGFQRELDLQEKQAVRAGNLDAALEIRKLKESLDKGETPEVAEPKENPRFPPKEIVFSTTRWWQRYKITGNKVYDAEHVPGVGIHKLDMPKTGWTKIRKGTGTMIKTGPNTYKIVWPESEIVEEWNVIGNKVAMEFWTKGMDRSRMGCPGMAYLR